MTAEMRSEMEAQASYREGGCLRNFEDLGENKTSIGVCL